MIKDLKAESDQLRSQSKTKTSHLHQVKHDIDQIKTDQVDFTDKLHTYRCKRIQLVEAKDDYIQKQSEIHVVEERQIEKYMQSNMNQLMKKL